MLQIIKRVEEILKEPNSKSKHFKCLVCDISDGDKKEFEITLSEIEVELIETLNRIQAGAKLYPPMMNELWEKIQQYGNMKANIINRLNNEE